MKARNILFIFFILLNSSSQAQNTYKIKLGEITRIDYITGFVEVSIYDPEIENSIKNHSIESFVILDSSDLNNNKLSIQSYRKIDKTVYVQCVPGGMASSLYVGQAVGLLESKKIEPVLKDKIATEKVTQTTRVSKIDNSPMVLIPDGPFVFGSDIVGSDNYTTPIEYEMTELQKEMGQKRVRYLHLNSFYIDKYEITLEQYRQFANETASNMPPGYSPKMDPGLPVTNASYKMAESYCKWAGKRLPTELEWEKASRGPGIQSSYMKDDIEFFREKLNIYPTGLTFDPEKCVTEETLNHPENVYLLNDKNYYGLYGMCGNASEWTSSWFLPYRGNTIKNPNFGRKFKVIRGGSYNLPSKWTKSYERMIGGIPNLETDYRAGIRCAMDP